MSPADVPSELFRRDPANSIISASDVPLRASSVFNPGATRVGTQTVLLVRAEDRSGISHLWVARSPDGVSAWRFDSRPLTADANEDRLNVYYGAADTSIGLATASIPDVLAYLESGPAPSAADPRQGAGQ